MTKYIFHGGGAADDAFYAELVRDIPSQGIVLLVYFASRSDDNSDRIAYDTQKCEEFSSGKDISVQIATMEGFVQQAAEADVVYFRGGSTEKLLTSLKLYPDLKSVLENNPKIVAGTSAGAYALSTLYSCHYEDRAAEGLGIVPVRVVTHFESAAMPPRSGSVDILRNTRTDLDLIVLKEGEWKVVIV